MKGPLARPVVPLAGLDACRSKVLSGFGITTCINIIVMRRFHSIQFLDVSLTCVWQTWQRPTLPRLETKYHQRWSVSRPSSEWDRVQPLRHNHQVGKTHVISRSCFSCQGDVFCSLHSGVSPQARLRVAGFPAPSRSVRPKADTTRERWSDHSTLSNEHKE